MTSELVSNIRNLFNQCGTKTYNFVNKRTFVTYLFFSWETWPALSVSSLWPVVDPVSLFLLPLTSSCHLLSVPVSYLWLDLQLSYSCRPNCMVLHGIREVSTYYNYSQFTNMCDNLLGHRFVVYISFESSCHYFLFWCYFCSVFIALFVCLLKFCLFSILIKYSLSLNDIELFITFQENTLQSWKINMFLIIAKNSLEQTKKPFSKQF